MKTLTLVPPVDLINANQRLHHHKRAKLTKAWRIEAAVAVECRGFCCKYGRDVPAHVVVSIRFPTNHRRDVGNYYPTAKAIVDGLVDAGMLPDDNDQHLIGPDMRREYPNGPTRVTVTIREAEAA